MIVLTTDWETNREKDDEITVRATTSQSTAGTNRNPFHLHDTTTHPMTDPARCSLFILLLLLIVPAAAHDPGTLTVTFLDVGQGDSILVQAPNDRAMLIDAGEAWAGPTVSADLAAEGIARLDYLVASHDDDDHIGGIPAVLQCVTVGEYVSNGVPAETDTATGLRTLLADRQITTHAATAGETIPLDPDNLTVTVLNPPANRGTGQNENSVVLRLVFGTQSFLLTGDAGAEAEDRMLVSGEPVGATVLKVGHHGSGTGTGTLFVNAVNPEVAVIETGRFNLFHHPNQAVVKRLQESGAEVYTTAESGTVRITATRTSSHLETVQGPELPSTIPGYSLPPTDPDFDGTFEDVNGNQQRDFADVVAVFNQMDWIEANEPVIRFDFNRNGRMDFGDVVDLFTIIDEPIITPTPTPITSPSPTVTAAPDYTLAIAGLDLANEWVAVRNTGEAPVDLAGCTISDAGSVHVYTFPTFVLAPGSTVTVHTGSGTDTATDLFWGLGSSVWNNAGDTATLKRPDESVIAALTRP
jgi:beta-lactamase superfamily II metal-dependent hydrolase